MSFVVFFFFFFSHTLENAIAHNESDSNESEIDRKIDLAKNNRQVFRRPIVPEWSWNQEEEHAGARSVCHRVTSLDHRPNT